MPKDGAGLAVRLDIQSTMADIECPQCGRRALGVATRCPHCGEGFPPHLLQHPGSASRPHPPWLTMALAAILLAAGLAVLGRRGGGPPAAAVPAVAAEDTLPSLPAQRSGELPPPVADTAAPAAAPAAPPPEQPPPAGPALRRYARTWINVRSGRSGGAPGIRILSPGDTVLVDSLRRGWYRVLVDGRPQGYVDRSYLDTVPPLARP